MRRLARPLLGLVLAPTALAAFLAAARSLGGLASHKAAAWFLAGFAGYAFAYALGALRLRRAYVFAHELTHALAAWAHGAKVFRFVVRKESGHVDLSHSNAFIALAPYWVPVYAVFVVALYRLALWWGRLPGAYEGFLFLMGTSLAFHLLHTGETLASERQSDLGPSGMVLSLTLIALLNGLLILAALKCLFPGLVSMGDGLHWIGSSTLGFWGGAWRWVERAFTIIKK